MRRVTITLANRLRRWAWFLLIFGLLLAGPGVVVGDRLDTSTGVVLLLVSANCFWRARHRP